MLHLLLMNIMNFE